MPFININEVADKSFDYIIIGGGTAGLVVAARLTEDPKVNVLVLEAGPANLHDPLILRPAQLGMQFFQPKYDWAFKTVPQKHANGNQFFWSRGKGLGGSSAMNFQCWIKPSKDDIDDWEKLGNPGWNWESFEKYSDKTSSFTPLSLAPDELIARGAEVLKVWATERGTGPLKTTHPKRQIDVDLKAHQTLLNLGIPLAAAPNHGDPKGTYRCLNTLDPNNNSRSYAATAFYTPNASRPNFHVLVNAYSTKIVTTGTNDLTATGVEFSYGEDKKIYVAHAKKEVVLSAGALKSPQILELSGIGRPDVLNSVGIPVKVALDGVGENVQEHNFIGTSYKLKPEIADETFDLLRDPAAAAKHADLFAQGQGVHMTGVVNVAFLPLEDVSPRAAQIHAAAKAQVEEGIASGKYSAGLAEQYAIQLARIERKAAGSEYLTVPGLLSFPNPPEAQAKYVSIVAATNYNFSRGTIHITTKDPLADPAFDPHYFEHDIDLQTIVEELKFARKISQTAPYKDMIESELNPGPKIQTDEELSEYAKTFLGTTFHTAGSLSMLPREKGGVVDAKLKVYGTTNIRVADLSIVPLHFAAHSQAAAYVIGEKAADIIKGL